MSEEEGLAEAMEPEAKKRKGEGEGEKEKGGPEHHLQPPPLVTQESIGLGRLPSFDLENLGVLDPAPGGAGGIGAMRETKPREASRLEG